jgi:outer membrane protein assembly factor BamB
MMFRGIFMFLCMMCIGFFTGCRVNKLEAPEEIHEHDTCSLNLILKENTINARLHHVWCRAWKSSMTPIDKKYDEDIFPSEEGFNLLIPDFQPGADYIVCLIGYTVDEGHNPIQGCYAEKTGITLTRGEQTDVDMEWLYHEKWRFKLDNGKGGPPAIGPDGTVYVISTDYFQQSGHYLYAVNPDRILKWKYSVTGNTTVKSIPVIGMDGTIHFVYRASSADTLSYYLEAVNADGSLRWCFTEDESANSILRNPPAIASGGRIYIGSPDYLTVLDPDGILLNRYEYGVKTSLIIGQDGAVYFGGVDGFYAVNPDGSLRWRCDHITNPDNLFAIDYEGVIYSGHHVAGFHAISSDGTIKYFYQSGTSIAEYILIDIEGTIYCQTRRDMDAVASDGTGKWFIKGYGHPAAIGADGVLYLIGGNYLYAVSRDGIPQWYHHTEYLSHTIAIADDGTVYLGTDGYLVALQTSSMGLAGSAWPKLYHDNRNTGNISER